MHDVIIDDRQSSYAVTSKMEEKNSSNYRNKVNKAIKSSFVNNLLDWFIKGLLLSSLVCFDFFVFMGAGSYSVFSTLGFFQPEVWGIVVSVTVVCFILMYLVSFLKILQNLLLSVALAFLMIAFLNQFAAFDKNAMLSSLVATYISPDLGLLLTYVSHVVFAIVSAVIFFLFLTYASKSKIFTLAVLVLIINAVVLFSQLIDDNNGKKFISKKDSTVSMANDNGKNFVFIGMPALGSFSYFQDLKQNMSSKNLAEVTDLQKNLDIILGFYKKNNFMFYPQSYVLSENAYENFAQILNLNNSKDSKEYINKTVVPDKFWKFNLLNEKDIFLKEAKLFEAFKKSKFFINAYQNQGIEFCKINNEFVVDSCVEQNNLPINFEEMDISVREKMTLLFAQWMESTGLFNDLSSLYSSLKIVTDADKTPMIGISYKNIGVKNSLDILNVLSKDIATRHGNQAYFVNLNMPNNTFIFDEFCQIKPLDQWENKSDLPWIKVVNFSEKRKAYYNQVRCLYGALQDFIDAIPEEKRKNTVIVLQSLSGFGDMYQLSDNVNFVEEFMNKKFVDTAIYDPKKAEFSLYNQVCYAPSVLKKYLYKQDACIELEHLNIQNNLQQKVLDKLHSFKFDNSQLDNAVKFFDNWYEEWLKHNKAFVIKPKMLPKKTVEEKVISE